MKNNLNIYNIADMSFKDNDAQYLEQIPKQKVKEMLIDAMKKAITLSKGGTVYHKDTTVTLPPGYQGVDG